MLVGHTVRIAYYPGKRPGRQGCVEGGGLGGDPSTPSVLVDGVSVSLAHVVAVDGLTISHAELASRWRRAAAPPAAPVDGESGAPLSGGAYLGLLAWEVRTALWQHLGGPTSSAVETLDGVSLTLRVGATEIVVGGAQREAAVSEIEATRECALELRLVLAERLRRAETEVRAMRAALEAADRVGAPPSGWA